MIFKRLLNNRQIKFAFLVVAACSLFSCVAYRYSTPYQTYNHEIHEESLLDRNMDCFSCHKVDINETDPIKRLTMIRDMLKEDNDKRFDAKQCHVCHLDEKTKRSDAPSKCRLCHEILQEITTQDHQGVWENSHATIAKVSDKNCLNCHDRWYCVDCHTSRDMTNNNMHPRVFKLNHAVAAKVDPASCSSCHRSSFCRDCHGKAGVR